MRQCLGSSVVVINNESSVEVFVIDSAPVSVAPVEVVANFVFVECLRVTPALPPYISVPAKAPVPDCPMINAEPHSASTIVLI